LFTDAPAEGALQLSENYTGYVGDWLDHPLARAQEKNKKTNGRLDPDRDVAKQDVLEAIKFLKTDSRESWIKIIFSLKAQYPALADAKEFLDAYSDHWKGKPGYDTHQATITAYNGAKPTDISIATLFYDAAENGYIIPSRVACAEDFEVFPSEKDAHAVEATTAQKNKTPISIRLHKIAWEDAGKKGTPYNTLENWGVLLRAFGVTVRYNTMAKDIEINIPDRGYSPEFSLQGSITDLESCAVRHNLATQSMLPYLKHIADKNRYNPAADWVTSKQWDGVDRIEPLAKAFNAKNPILAYKLFRRWVISAVAALFSINGVAAQGVLVLQGKQNTHKTSMIDSLIPEPYKDWIKLGASLNPSDKHSVKQVATKWIVELGELDSTLKRDIGALKAFITNNKKAT